MDTITHGIVGALIGKAFFADIPPPEVPSPSWPEPRRTASRVAIGAATMGAIFFDIDVFAGPLANNGLAMLTWHRSITHSVVLLPLWAVALALLSSAVTRRLRWSSPSFAVFVSIYAVTMASHVFLDLITSFGTMVWSPLDDARPAWDWVFIIDLTLTSAALVPQLAAWAFRHPRGAARRAFTLWALLAAAAFALGPLIRPLDVPYSTRTALGAALVFGAFLLVPLWRGSGVRAGRTKWCRAGIALVAGYLVFTGGMHHMALARVREFAAQSSIPAENVAALPLPPSAAGWAGMISTSTGIYRLPFNLLDGKPVRHQFFANSRPNRDIAEARARPDVQTFLWFARFPLFRYFERDGQHILQISDLRFYRPRQPTGEARSSNPPSNFTFQVVFASDGRVVSSGPLQSN